MGIQDCSENIILVELPMEPEMAEEIDTVTELVHTRSSCDVVVDFSDVDVITSPSLSKLLKLRQILTDYGNRLIFCNVAISTKRIFLVTGLDQISEFADDKDMALTCLQNGIKQELLEKSQDVVTEGSNKVSLERLWQRNAKID